MKLSSREDRAPNPPFTKRSVDNDNGILFVVYFYFLCAKLDVLGASDRERFMATVPDLRRMDSSGAPIKGLFVRNPGRTDGDALDNYRAIAAGSALFGASFADDICEYGEREGYVFNSETIGQYEIKDWKQGSDVCFYKLCAGRIPAPWELLWFCCGFIFGAYLGLNDSDGNPTQHASEHLMDWMMGEALDRVKIADKAQWMISAAKLCRAFWRWRLLKKTGGRGIEMIFEIYFKSPDHPNRVLSAGMSG